MEIFQKKFDEKKYFVKIKQKLCLDNFNPISREGGKKKIFLQGVRNGNDITNNASIRCE